MLFFKDMAGLINLMYNWVSLGERELVDILELNSQYITSVITVPQFLHRYVWSIWNVRQNYVLLPDSVFSFVRLDENSVTNIDCGEYNFRSISAFTE